jgi:hypothetical protein
MLEKLLRLLRTIPEILIQRHDPFKFYWYILHLNMYLSSTILIEEYNHALIFTDSQCGFSWQYGMERKDKTLNLITSWFAEIVDIIENYPLLAVMRVPEE